MTTLLDSAALRSSCAQMGEQGSCSNSDTFSDLTVSNEPDKGSRFYLVFHPWHNADHSKYFMNVF